MNQRFLILLTGAVCCVQTLVSCASVDRKPRMVTDPVEIALHQEERLHWERKAQQVRPGMTRAEVERYLPRHSFRNAAWTGTVFESSYWTDGTRDWYYLSSDFICEVSYAYTGLTKDFEEEARLDSKQKLRAAPRIAQVRRPRPSSRW